MHLPTYIFLMTSAVIYGLHQTIVLWQTNWLLFAASIFIATVTAAGAILQSAKQDDFEFKWMLWYTIPLGLLAVSSLMQNAEVSDSAMRMAGITPPLHIIPGTSEDYKNAATDHYHSMIFPFIAWMLSKCIQLIIKCFARNENA